MRAATTLERRYRTLLRCYPAGWRRRHEEEMVAVLLDEAEATGRSTVSAAAVLDLVGHGAEERLESLLRWLPRRLRTQIAMTALVTGGGLALVMLVGELVGARYRPPAQAHSHLPYFDSGPFLTVGVALYLAQLSAALLAVRGHGGLARLLLVAAVGYAAWMRWSAWSLSYPTPRLLVLALLGGLGLLAALATIRPTPRTARAMVAFGAGFLTALTVGLAATKPILGWSVGTLTTSGNVAFAALAAVLPFLVAAALLGAALQGGRRPGWSAAIAVAAFPVVVFCTITSQVLNPNHAAERAWYPLYYLLAAVGLALAHRRGRRQTPLLS